MHLFYLCVLSGHLKNLDNSLFLFLNAVLEKSLTKLVFLCVCASVCPHTVWAASNGCSKFCCAGGTIAGSCVCTARDFCSMVWSCQPQGDVGGMSKGSVLVPVKCMQKPHKLKSFSTTHL